VGRLADLRRVTERELTAVARRRREAEALAEAVRIVSARSLDEGAVEGILEATGQVVPSGYRAVLLAEDEDQVLVVGADVGGPESRRGRRLPIGEGVAGRAFTARASQIVADGRRAALAVPIEGRERCLGVLYLEDEQPGRFGEHDAELLREFCRYAAVALDSLAAAQALRSSEERFARYFHSHPIPGFITRVGDSRMIDVNEDFCALFGYSRDEVIGRTSLEVGLWVDPDDLERRRAAIARDGFIRDWEAEFRRKDGRTGNALLSVQQADVGGERCVITALLDITERKRSEALLTRQARHDALTDLPNRTLLAERMRRAVDGGDGGALMVMDLDRFKEVNDTFGHDVGDGLLREVGRRIERDLPAGSTLARLGGDEFAVFVPAADRADAARIAARIIAETEQAFWVGELNLSIGTSIGVALAEPGSSDPVVLLRRADIAMYDAKRTGSGWCFYAPEQDGFSPARLQAVADLRLGMGRGELELHYQPVLDLVTDTFDAAEALARWRHPDRGLLAASEFVPLAEQTGLIKPLTDFVLMGAIAQCSRWRREGRTLAVAINLSVRNLTDPQLVDLVANLLAGADVPGSQLMFEITESALMTEPERVLVNLRALKRMGIRLAVDDFGSGYSSLGYLHRLPIDRVKIDRAFVRNLTADPTSRVIVDGAVRIAHGLGLAVVAEGVEDERTLALVREIGCDAAQGYAIARPMSAEALESLLPPKPVVALQA